MRKVSKALGILSGLLLMFVVLIGAVEFVAYGIDGYYERAYTKYDVLSAVDMEMDDLLYVTQEMMDYLRGNRENLVVETIVGGQPQEFFNEKEIRHMVDVQVLFTRAETLRLMSAGLIVLLGCAMFYQKRGRAFLTGIQWGMGVFFGSIVLLGGLMATDFNRYFTIFHEIFFDNDDWLLDPATDLLINIVPEGFFFDTAFLIVAVFLGVSFVLFGAMFVVKKKMRTEE